MEKYSRGRRGAPAKGVGRATGARVQIPLSPLAKGLVKPILFLLFINQLKWLSSYKKEAKNNRQKEREK